MIPFKDTPEEHKVDLPQKRPAPAIDTSEYYELIYQETLEKFSEVMLKSSDVRPNKKITVRGFISNLAHGVIKSMSKNMMPDVVC